MTWVAAKIDYGNCYYEGDTPDVEIQFFRTQKEAEDFADWSGDFKKVPDHV